MKNKIISLSVIFLLLLSLVMPLSVNAVSYDPNYEPVYVNKVKEDGTISWIKDMYGYQIFIKSVNKDSYGTCILQDASSDNGEVSFNLISLIKEKLGDSYKSLYGIIDNENGTGTYNVLIKENNSMGLYKNSEFTVTYESNKLSGSIVGAEQELPIYTVKFDTKGGSKVESQKIKYGQKVVIPEDPIKDGYFFVGWYENIYDIITEDTTFTAMWAKIYDIIEGRDSIFYLNSNNDIVLKIDVNNYKPYYIDVWNDDINYEEELTDENFKNENGSSTFILKNSYLKTLKPGIYNIYLEFDDGCEGFSSTTFTVKEGSEEKNTNADQSTSNQEKSANNSSQPSSTNKSDTSNNQQNQNTSINKLPFTDVKESDWFFNAVKYTYTNGIISGYNKTTFAPNDKLTRGMIVTILYRMEGSPNNNGKSKFSDVSSNEWYSKAVKWAVDNGVVHGYGGTNNFGPNDNIIRQDLAGILRNYAVYKKKNGSTLGDITKFKDYKTVSDYAVTSMKWAVGAGVITGNSDGTLNPKGNATRAETAAMIQKYCNKVGK